MNCRETLAAHHWESSAQEMQKEKTQMWSRADLTQASTVAQMPFLALPWIKAHLLHLLLNPQGSLHCINRRTCTEERGHRASPCDAEFSHRAWGQEKLQEAARGSRNRGTKQAGGYTEGGHKRSGTQMRHRSKKLVQAKKYRRETRIRGGEGRKIMATLICDLPGHIWNMLVCQKLTCT